MTIHTIQEGDTIKSIAETYDVPVSRIEKDNDLAPHAILSVGHALMITYPLETYIVKAGDTLDSIAGAFGVTKLELLRNNPQFSDISSLTEGEEVIIRYENKENQIYVNGFINYSIDLKVLKKTLPYLTYLTIMNYMIQEGGGFMSIQEEPIIKMARQYGVAPLMFVSSFDIYGTENYETIHHLLNDPEAKELFILQISNTLKRKDYYGLYLGFQNILEEDLKLYAEFVEKITNTLNNDGFEVFVSLIPYTFGFTLENPNNNPYFSQIGQAANYVTLMTYQWLSQTIPEFADTGAYFLDAYVRYAVTQIPPDKIYLGLGRIAYDWYFPYTQDNELGHFISDFGAVNLANQYNTTIYLEENSQLPYYYYTDWAGLEHFIWYKDARTVDAIIDIIYKYGLRGVAVWNVMYYFSPTFIVLNTQYDIVHILNNTI